MRHDKQADELNYELSSRSRFRYEDEGEGDNKDATPRLLIGYEQTSAHLANERTFIAWSGVGVLLIICAVPIARFSNTLTNVDNAPLLDIAYASQQAHGINSITMGLAFLAAGTLLILLAIVRYLTVQQQIVDGDYHPSGMLSYAFLSIMLLLTGILTLHLLFIRGM
jgi:putative membrane protein